jgi:hypothetical protein
MEKRKEGVFAVRLTGLEALNGEKSENGENDALNSRRKAVRRVQRCQNRATPHNQSHAHLHPRSAMREMKSR